jgi:aminoglycoside phosphotransferase (APT) family kinase protein
MPQPWTAEERVTPEHAARLISEQFPALAPVQLELLGEGWDNVAYLVNGTHVFRFPRRQIAIGLLEAERKLLPLVARHVSLPIPAPTHSGQPTESFRWPFLGYCLIRGRSLSAARPTEAQRRALAEPLAAFLRSLHSVPSDEARSLGAGPHFVDKLAFARILPEASRNLDQLQQKGLFEPPASLLSLLSLPPPSQPGPTVLCHGDLYSLHVLVDDETRLSGVIDWGDLHLGDVAVDLSAAYLLLPRDAHDTFCRAYGPIDSSTWERARLRALFHASTTAVYGEHLGDSALLEGSLWALREIAHPSEPRTEALL